MTPVTVEKDSFLKLSRQYHRSLRRFFYTVLFEEPLDLPGTDSNTCFARYRFLQIFETCIGMLDKLYQDQHRDLCRKLSRQTPDGHGSALDDGNSWIAGEIDMGQRQFLALELALAIQLNQDGMAPYSKFCAQCFCGHAPWASCCKIDQGAGQTPGPREADVAEKPQAVPVEKRDRMKRIPTPVVGEAAEVSDLGKKATNRRNRIPHLGGKGFDHPAGLLLEKSEKTLVRLFSGSHSCLLIKYCTIAKNQALFAILYQEI